MPQPWNAIAQVRNSPIQILDELRVHQGNRSRHGQLCSPSHHGIETLFMNSFVGGRVGLLCRMVAQFLPSGTFAFNWHPLGIPTESGVVYSCARWQTVICSLHICIAKLEILVNPPSVISPL